MLVTDKFYYLYSAYNYLQISGIDANQLHYLPNTYIVGHMWYKWAGGSDN